MTQRTKVTDIMALVRRCLREGMYLISEHANKRLDERRVTLPELFFVLDRGHHEKAKDVYDAISHSWRYAVKGKTVDGRRIRVVVAFNAETRMLIVTVIDCDN